MSRFYLTMNGGKSNSETVTRRAYGGAHTICASWQGAIKCEPYVGPDNVDYVRVTRTGWKGSGGAHVVLYDGPFDVASGNYATDLR